MARPRESDRRNHPDQSERLIRAMRWAGVASAAELSERMDGAMTGPTLNNRIQGNHKLKPVEIGPIADALGVSPAVLLPDGPTLPDPSDAHVHVVLTGEPGNWTITTIAPNEEPQTVTITTSDRPDLPSLVRGPPPNASHLPSDSNQPSTSQSSAEQGPRAAES